MNKNLKNSKGITLIALVITIIVMLILVTVTIRVATDGNLFTHAANAAKDTKAHVQNETAILNDDLGIESIVAEATGETDLAKLQEYFEGKLEDDVATFTLRWRKNLQKQFYNNRCKYKYNR